MQNVLVPNLRWLLCVYFVTQHNTVLQHRDYNTFSSSGFVLCQNFSWPSCGASMRHLRHLWSLSSANLGNFQEHALCVSSSHLLCASLSLRVFIWLLIIENSIYAKEVEKENESSIHCLIYTSIITCLLFLFLFHLLSPCSLELVLFLFFDRNLEMKLS